uniref:Uncharacterized protein n=1 Tax=Anguilla anguilla TaxID=7936 RepID=A0A0E9Y0F6_ANGAN
MSFSCKVSLLNTGSGGPTQCVLFVCSLLISSPLAALVAALLIDYSINNGLQIT